MKILHLTLKKKWFDMIASGEKKEEYREFKSYWWKRLWTRDQFIGLDGGYFNTYDIVRFKNGYSKDAPVMDVECLSVGIGSGIPEWGGSMETESFVIKLGKVLSISINTDHKI